MITIQYRDLRCEMIYFSLGKPVKYDGDCVSWNIRWHISYSYITVVCWSGLIFSDLFRNLHATHTWWTLQNSIDYSRRRHDMETLSSLLTLGLYSLSGKTSYRQISWSVEAARLDVAMVVSLWNLTDTSAAALPRYLPNFRAIGNV